MAMLYTRVTTSMKHSKKHMVRPRLRTPSRIYLWACVGLLVVAGSVMVARNMAAPDVVSRQAGAPAANAAANGTDPGMAKSKAGDAPKPGAPPTASAPAKPPAAKPAPQVASAPPKPALASPKPAIAPPPTPTTGASRMVKFTFYGAYDNDPPGSRAIAHPVIHQLAGGTGSYADPLTFASPSGAGEYAWGQIIYVPMLQKYFIREDSCGVSWTAPSGCGGVDMVDLYVGNPSGAAGVIACEEALTPDGSAEIIVNPAANLAYDATPLWNEATGMCAAVH